MHPSIVRAGRIALIVTLAVSLAACGGRRRAMQARAATPPPVSGVPSTPGGNYGSGTTAGQVLRDVAYGSDAQQRFDVYLPANASNAPVIFMVHGGAWRLGDKAADKVVDNKVAHWVPKGFIFISTNYRLTADPLSQAGDVAQAVAYAQNFVAGHGGDSSRFILMGHSAGGHLAGMVAASPSLASSHGAKPWLGFVSLDGQQDIVRRMEAPHQRFLDKAFGKDPNYWRAASPIYQLTSAIKLVLLICSTQRAEDSCPQAQEYASKVASLGGKAKVVALDLSHEEINVTLGQPGGYTDDVDAFIRSLGVSF